MDAEMKEDTSTSRPSLDRLKALNTLPDLASQLEEAERLCSRTARADMIAKWLLDKLKSSGEAQVAPLAWKCLLHTSRLIWPERLASLLSSYDILGTIKKALEDPQCSHRVVASINEIITFLLDQSRGGSGVIIEAVLSAPAAQASILLGTWLNRASSTVEPPDSDPFDMDHTALIQPALRMWDLRKHTVDENELFAKNCLLPAALVLLQYPNLPTAQSSKRKRNGDNKPSPIEGERALESLLARNVFLPARTAFFKARDRPSDRSRKAEPPSDILATMLKPLKSSILNRPDSTDHTPTLALLLDVALRCTPSSAPKQRIREAPWVEAVFEAIHDCNKRSDGTLVNQIALTGMLKVITLRSSLSRVQLEQIVQLYSGLYDSSDSHVDWELIAQVIELDSNVFAVANVAERLFSRLTEASIELSQKPMTDATDPSTPPTKWAPGILRKFWKDKIVIPVIHAFGRNRDIDTFIKLWRNQLRQDSHEETWSVWAELEGEIQPLLEDAMTDTQLEELFHHLCSSISSKLNSQLDEWSQSTARELKADTVILNAVLRALQSEAILDHIGDDLDKLYEHMAKLCQRPPGPTVTRESPSPTPSRWSWKLMTKAFELWFPSWAARQQDPAVVGLKASSPTFSTTIKAAVDFWKVVYSNPEGYASLMPEASEAQIFLVTLFCCFRPYKEHIEEHSWLTLSEAVVNFMKRVDGATLQIVLQHPELLLFVEHPREEFLASLFTIATDAEDPKKLLQSADQALRAITTTAVQRAEMEVIQDLTEVFVMFLEEMGDATEYDIVKVRLVNGLLLQISPYLLNRAQRERILNASLEFHVLRSDVDQELVRTSLALMIQLMELPNATSTLATDHTAVFRVALSVDAKACAYSITSSSKSEETSEAQTNALVEELTKLVLKHLLATQDQQRSRDVLIAMSEDANEIVEAILSVRQVAGHGTALAVTKSILRELERGVKGELRNQLPHRESGAITRFVEYGVGFLTDKLSETQDAELISLRSMAETMLAMVGSMESMSSNATPTVDFDALKARLEEGIHNALLQRKTAHPGQGEQEEDKANDMSTCLVLCFKIACEVAPPNADVEFASLAGGLLRLPLQPFDHDSVTTAFGRHIQKLDGKSWLRLLESLLPADRFATSSHLLLIQICTLHLTKEGIEGADTSMRHPLLHRLLIAMKGNQDILGCKRAINSTLNAIKSKAFLTEQHGIEEVLVTVMVLLEQEFAVSILYMDICRIMSTLLLQHRSRLHGRLHLVMLVFQSMMSRLFQSVKSRRIGGSQSRPLTSKHAHAFARLLTLFCEPPQLRRETTNASKLTDESRKEQAYVGQYVQYILHHYCHQILNGTLGEGVREALTPGLWSIIDAMQMNDADRVKSLSAAMNNSERAVLRGVYEDWRRFGKWKGS